MMDNCYSGDHKAESPLHMDITKCNIEEPQQKLRIGTVSNFLMGLGWGLKYVLLNPNARPLLWFELFGLYDGPNASINQHMK